MRYRYAQSTVDRILRLISEQPGLTGRQIAARLSLRKDHVNSWLYSEGKRKYGLQVKDYAWGHTGVNIPARTRNPKPWERKQWENDRREASKTEEQILRERERQWEQRNAAPQAGWNPNYTSGPNHDRSGNDWGTRQRDAFERAERRAERWEQELRREAEQEREKERLKKEKETRAWGQNEKTRLQKEREMRDKAAADFRRARGWDQQPAQPDAAPKEPEPHFPTVIQIGGMSRAELNRLCAREDFGMMDNERLAAIGNRSSSLDHLEKAREPKPYAMKLKKDKSTYDAGCLTPLAVAGLLAGSLIWANALQNRPKPAPAEPAGVQRSAFGGTIQSPTDWIESCYDGDTCTTIQGEKLWIACVDTPAMGESGAIAARNYSRGFTADGVWVNRLGADRYGRTVAQVYSRDGKSLGQELVRKGHAEVDSRFAHQCDWTRTTER